MVINYLSEIFYEEEIVKIVDLFICILLVIFLIEVGIYNYI